MGEREASLPMEAQGQRCDTGNSSPTCQDGSMSPAETYPAQLAGRLSYIATSASLRGLERLETTAVLVAYSNTVVKQLSGPL